MLRFNIDLGLAAFPTIGRQFNERTFEAYGQEGLDPPRGILAVKARYQNFKSKFKEDKGPLQIIIKSMHRRPKIIFDKTGKAIKIF